MGGFVSNRFSVQSTVPSNWTNPANLPCASSLTLLSRRNICFACVSPAIAPLLAVTSPRRPRSPCIGALGAAASPSRLVFSLFCAVAFVACVAHGNNLIVKPIQMPTMLLPAILLAVLLLAAQAQDANIVVLTETVIQFCVINPPLLI